MKKIKLFFQKMIMRIKLSSFYKKIFQWYLNKFKAANDEFYSYDMPTDEEMKGKTYWIQICRNDDTEGI